MPKIQNAYYATSLKAVRDAGPEYSRVYFGAEFCQWLLPGPASVAKAYEAARQNGQSFTLMTPWLTDAGLNKAVRLLGVLEAMDDEKAEVVVNDFGLLSVARKKFPSVTPVLGRLLVRQKCCPRIPGFIGELPEPGREVYLHAGVDDPVTAGFLGRFGVKRVELDNPLQGVEVDLKRVRMKGSLYTPYAYVTTTRHCPASFDGERWQAFSGCRTKACRKVVLEMKNRAHDKPLLMRGGTQFVENALLPEDIAGMGIDRIVKMESLP